MSAEDRFKQSTINVLAKRAANICSNPDCRALTSGPSSLANDFVNVGEAAHIYGANPGSARYDPRMLPSERNSISNAIWLCGNCHKLVDDDPDQYPAGLLFEWQREHERLIMQKIGKASADARMRYEERHLEEFGLLSYLAQRIILEKGDYWEYRLTAEVLRFELIPIVRRWEALREGYYVKQKIRINDDDFFSWVSEKLDEMISIVDAFVGLINKEFSRSWGEPGVPGNDLEIVLACRLFTEACRSALAWEESVRFVRVNPVFEECLRLLSGIAGGVIEQAARIPLFLSAIFAEETPAGRRELVLTVSVPEGWVDDVRAAMSRAAGMLKI